jgi:hypothetical protein
MKILGILYFSCLKRFIELMRCILHEVTSQNLEYDKLAYGFGHISVQ